MRKEKGAREHSQATAPTPGVVTSLSLPVSSRAWPVASLPPPEQGHGRHQARGTGQTSLCPHDNPGHLESCPSMLCPSARRPAVRPQDTSCRGRQWKQLGH